MSEIDSEAGRIADAIYATVSGGLRFGDMLHRQQWIDAVESALREIVGWATHDEGCARDWTYGAGDKATCDCGLEMNLAAARAALSDGGDHAR